MSKTAKVKEPSPELLIKIENARIAVSEQRTRAIKCPYCQRHAIIVFEDTRGHVQTKCKNCGQETIFDVASMRRVYSGI